MANTGLKIVLTLKQVNSVTFDPTGLTEPNTPGTADYIPPYDDYVACPISSSLACPLAIFQGYTGLIGYEFSLYNSVVDNPRVDHVYVEAISGSIAFPVAGGNTVRIPLPNSTPNYFSGSIILGAGSYQMEIQYVSSSIALGSCSYTSSIIVH